MAKQTHYDKQQLYILESLEKAEISDINDNIDKTNEHFMSHDDLQEIYNSKNQSQCYITNTLKYTK